MISTLAYQPQMKISMEPVSESTDLSRIFAAAVVNRQFCQMLLQDPHTALQKGYLGETFSLRKEEVEAIVSIRAESLTDFARQLGTVLASQ